MGEFDLIQKFFTRKLAPQAAVNLGIGDDCALLQTPPEMQLAISTDMLVEGRHFLSTVDPAALGHKALAVNLSDLAACGAKPVAFSLALALPSVDSTWLEGFSQGLFALADAHGCTLIGGDTTKGPLNICITVYGHVPRAEALLRSGAQVGDDIYVSGASTQMAGEARMALEVFRGNLSLPQEVFAQVRTRMERPTPRVELGQALRGIATSCVDVSDGLIGDLGHILKKSGVGAHLETAWLGALEPSCALAHIPKGLQRIGFAFAGGDDYELCFTAPANKRASIQAAALDAGCTVQRIGQITETLGLVIVDASGAPIQHGFASFDHFK